MTSLLIILFLVSCSALVHTYLFYPWQLARKVNVKIWEDKEYHPRVSILFSAFNEEKVIEEKLRSTFDTNYPIDKVEVLIGSDCSYDRTDEIIESLKIKYPSLVFYPFVERRGKPAVINELIGHCTGSIVIMTDADTFFNQDTISEMVLPFLKKEIGGVQGKILSKGDGSLEVLNQELLYNKREFNTKRGESNDGIVMGAHGACYSLRKELYTPVPKGFSVDDFFIFMNILKQGYKTVFNEKATSTMILSGNAGLQFKRKSRMGAGNYRNLIWFREFVNPFRSKLNYAFFSHKFLRWVSPFLLIVAFLSSFFLRSTMLIWDIAFISQVLFYLIAITDFFLRRIKINLPVFRLISHFVMMNVAFLVGFGNTVLGRASDTWHNR